VIFIVGGVVGVVLVSVDVGVVVDGG